MTVISPAEYGGSWLARGGVLRSQSLTSPSGRCVLIHEPSGGVSLYDNARAEPIWMIPVQAGSACLALGLDGELTVRDHDRAAMWSSGTAGSGAERLAVRDTGEAVLLDGGGTVIWTTGTHVAAAGLVREPARGSTMRRGQTLQRQTLTSADGSTVLIHYGSAVWLLDGGQQVSWIVVYGADRTYLVLDHDGMLRVRGGDGGVALEIAGPGAELAVLRGRAELRAADGTVVWTTAPGGARDGPDYRA